MRRRTLPLLMVCLIAGTGCGNKKSTDELIADTKSANEGDRLKAVRLLPEHKGDAAQVVPALIAALKDKHNDIRRSAAIGLGSFGEHARDAIPALQAALYDHDALVREAAGVALTRIDPTLAPKTKPGKANRER